LGETLVSLSHKRIWLVLFIVATLALGGCAHVEKTSKSDGLKSASLRYAKGLRWGDYEGAMALTRLPDGKVDPVDIKYLKNIKVTHYDVSPAILSESQEEGYVTLYLDYYHELRNSVHQITVPQTWRYDEEDKRWYCETPMPEFKP
jgi:uncharacterized protein YceK